MRIFLFLVEKGSNVKNANKEEQFSLEDVAMLAMGTLKEIAEMHADSGTIKEHAKKSIKKIVKLCKNRIETSN